MNKHVLELHIYSEMYFKQNIHSAFCVKCMEFIKPDLSDLCNKNHSESIFGVDINSKGSIENLNSLDNSIVISQKSIKSLKKLGKFNLYLHELLELDGIKSFYTLFKNKTGESFPIKVDLNKVFLKNTILFKVEPKFKLKRKKARISLYEVLCRNNNTLPVLKKSTNKVEEVTSQIKKLLQEQIKSDSFLTINETNLQSYIQKEIL